MKLLEIEIIQLKKLVNILMLNKLKEEILTIVILKVTKMLSN